MNTGDLILVANYYLQMAEMFSAATTDEGKDLFCQFTWLARAATRELEIRFAPMKGVM